MSGEEEPIDMKSYAQRLEEEITIDIEIEHVSEQAIVELSSRVELPIAMGKVREN